ncbi:hypothetical protein KR009_000954 [Drosophila setifemur]|nr:hypothetical protein KR009_000954 [Drosophila setifemur]
MQAQAMNGNCDVTLRQSSDAAACDESAALGNWIFSAAFRAKTNAEPSGGIYTSTPKTSHQRPQQQQIRKQQSHQLHCVGAVEPKEKGRVGVFATFDPRLKTVALLFGFLIIGYKSVILTMPYISADSIQEFTHQVQSQWRATIDWSSRHKLGSLMSPLLWGLLVAGFAYGIVFLDSAVPGVNPPSPFTPRSKKRFYDEKRASLHLGYLCALSCGFLVTVFMYFDLYSS